MHVVHIYKTFFPETFGGLEQAIRQIGKATGSLGVRNTVVTLAPDPRSQPPVVDGIDVRQIKATAEIASNPLSVAFFRRFLDVTSDADVLHYHFPWPTGEIAHLLRRPPQPALVTYHSDIVRQRFLKRLYAPLMRRFLDHVRIIVTTSPEYGRTSEDLRPWRQKCRTIPLCMDEHRFPAVAPQTLVEMHRRFGEDFFLFVGLFRHYKGLPFLLRAAKGSPHRLVVVGDGPLRGRLEKTVRKDGLANVTFAGVMDDESLAALFSLARSVVLPSVSRAEAFGLSLLEGAAFGKPLISTRLGTGTSYVNAHEETGLVVAPKDPAALRAAMDRLASDDLFALRCGARARQRHCDLFTPVAVGRGYRDLYVEVLQDGMSR